MSEVTWETLLSEQIRQNGRLFYQLAYRILRDGADAPVRHRVRETRHGPVVSDLDPDGAAGGPVLAVSMANLASDDTSATLDEDGTQHEVAYADVTKALVQIEFNRKSEKKDD